MTSTPAATDTVIVAVAVAAGHDGSAEAVITLRYPNAATRDVTFGCDALASALAEARLESLDALVGRSWDVLVPSLTAAPRPRP